MELVRTRLIKSDGEAVALNYLMRPGDEGWQIVDIFLKGSISELATRRSEYSSVLRREGYDKLIAMLSQKIAHLDNQRAARVRGPTGRSRVDRKRTRLNSRN